MRSKLSPSMIVTQAKTLHCKRNGETERANGCIRLLKRCHCASLQPGSVKHMRRALRGVPNRSINVKFRNFQFGAMTPPHAPSRAGTSPRPYPVRPDVCFVAGEGCGLGPTLEVVGSVASDSADVINRVPTGVSCCHPLQRAKKRRMPKMATTMMKGMIVALY